ncbi:MAG: DUF1080 domain-containing protein [Planctomycetes bacterium]|nr:DUF1080 domain-containing protein [Planctomycetota bacterium]
MHRSLTTLACLLLFSHVAGAENAIADDDFALPREQVEAGWIRLFDGHTLFGWKANNDPADGGVDWRVEEGTIVAERGKPGLLVTTVPFADYELSCDYRLVEGGNSGIFLRTTFEPIDASRDCYELNMCDAHPKFPTGSLVGRKAVAEKLDGEGEWKTYHVRCSGPRITVRLDGREILDFIDRSENARASGYIGLQKNVGRIEFKNVRLRPLGTKPLFDGKTLEGWRVVPGSKSRFTAVDGTIHVADGPGFLETAGQYGDFVLQFDARTNGRYLNSGVFFRAMKGTQQAPSHGYEVQIHNGYRDADPTQPMDFGTGAIFRRQKARRVVSQDNEWFTVTLIAHGPRFATWVNGYQQCDWLDERPPSENPREGLRLAPGHISLQGHDPTTDLAFRNLRLFEWPRMEETR